MITITPRQLHDRLQQGDAIKLARVNGFAKNQPPYIFCRTAIA